MSTAGTSGAVPTAYGNSEFGCVTVRGFCVGSFNVAAGTLIDVTVYGGSARAFDAV